jgi:hypothetical protein
MAQGGNALPAYLRFRPEEYQTVAQVSGPLLLRGPQHSFQRGLSEALRPAHPALAARIAGLGKRQALLLRVHLLAQSQVREQHSGEPGGEETSAVDELSYQEWRVLSRVCAVLLLRDNSLESFRSNLLPAIREAAPDLAARLARLEESRLAALYRRVRAGRRWCP